MSKYHSLAFTFWQNPAKIRQKSLKTVPVLDVTTEMVDDVQKLAKSGVPYFAYFGYHWC